MNIESIAKSLLEQNRRVSIAEADTCGLVTYLLSTVPGSSRWCPGGVIAYTGGLKQSILGISDEIHNVKGTVSPEMAIAMASGVRNITKTDYGLSVTGIAGPTGSRPGLPIGTFYLGLSGPNNLEVVERLESTSNDRDINKRRAAEALIELFEEELSKTD